MMNYRPIVAAKRRRTCVRSSLNHFDEQDAHMFPVCQDRFHFLCSRIENTTEGGSPQHTAQNQQQQEKTESILFFFAERKQKVTANFKDI